MAEVNDAMVGALLAAFRREFPSDKAAAGVTVPVRLHPHTLELGLALEQGWDGHPLDANTMLVGPPTLSALRHQARCKVAQHATPMIHSPGLATATQAQAGSAIAGSRKACCQYNLRWPAQLNSYSYAVGPSWGWQPAGAGLAATRVQDSLLQGTTLLDEKGVPGVDVSIRLVGSLFATPKQRKPKCTALHHSTSSNNLAAAFDCVNHLAMHEGPAMTGCTQQLKSNDRPRPQHKQNQAEQVGKGGNGSGVSSGHDEVTQDCDSRNGHTQSNEAACTTHHVQCSPSLFVGAHRPPVNRAACVATTETAAPAAPAAPAAVALPRPRANVPAAMAVDGPCDEDAAAETPCHGTTSHPNATFLETSPRSFCISSPYQSNAYQLNSTGTATAGAPSLLPWHAPLDHSSPQLSPHLRLLSPFPGLAPSCPGWLATPRSQLPQLPTPNCSHLALQPSSEPQDSQAEELKVQLQRPQRQGYAPAPLCLQQQLPRHQLPCLLSPVQQQLLPPQHPQVQQLLPESPLPQQHLQREQQLPSTVLPVLRLSHWQQQQQEQEQEQRHLPASRWLSQLHQESEKSERRQPMPLQHRGHRQQRQKRQSVPSPLPASSGQQRLMPPVPPPILPQPHQLHQLKQSALDSVFTAGLPLPVRQRQRPQTQCLKPPSPPPSRPAQTLSLTRGKAQQLLKALTAAAARAAAAAVGTASPVAPAMQSTRNVAMTAFPVPLQPPSRLQLQTRHCPPPAAPTSQATTTRSAAPSQISHAHIHFAAAAPPAPPHPSMTAQALPPQPLSPQRANAQNDTTMTKIRLTQSTHSTNVAVPQLPMPSLGHNVQAHPDLTTNSGSPSQLAPAVVPPQAPAVPVLKRPRQNGGGVAKSMPPTLRRSGRR